MVNVDMEVGDPKPYKAIQKAVSIASEILSKNNNCKIAILSHTVDTTTALQLETIKQLGHNNNLLVDTVARIQGITRDVTIYVIPDTDLKIYSLELRLFNVATSRATQNTFIICPDNILSFRYMSAEVRQFLNMLKNANE